MFMSSASTIQRMSLAKDDRYGYHVYVADGYKILWGQSSSRITENHSDIVRGEAG